MVLCAHGEFVSAFMFKEQRKPKLSHPELDIHERPYSLKNNESHANFRNSGAPREFKVEAMSLSMFSMCDIVFLFKSHSLLYRKFVHQQNKDHHLKIYNRRAQ